MPERIDLPSLKAEQYALNPEGRIVLVVGVDEAPLSGKSSLKHAVDDARAIATVLREEHCGFQLLMEPLLNEQATSTNVKRAVLNLKRSRSDNDFLLFYFSGHGWVGESEGGIDNVYLVTHDFSREEVNDDPNLHVSLKWLREMLYEQTEAGKSSLSSIAVMLAI